MRLAPECLVDWTLWLTFDGLCIILRFLWRLLTHNGKLHSLGVFLSKRPEILTNEVSTVHPQYISYFECFSGSLSRVLSVFLGFQSQVQPHSQSQSLVVKVIPLALLDWLVLLFQSLNSVVSSHQRSHQVNNMAEWKYSLRLQLLAL